MDQTVIIHLQFGFHQYIFSQNFILQIFPQDHVYVLWWRESLLF